MRYFIILVLILKCLCLVFFREMKSLFKKALGIFPVNSFPKILKVTVDRGSKLLACHGFLAHICQNYLKFGLEIQDTLDSCRVRALKTNCNAHGRPSLTNGFTKNSSKYAWDPVKFHSNA